MEETDMKVMRNELDKVNDSIRYAEQEKEVKELVRVGKVEQIKPTHKNGKEITVGEKKWTGKRR